MQKARDDKDLGGEQGRALLQRAADDGGTGLEKGELGRLLVRGEYGHDIVDELRPVPGEVVVDKPGKGLFEISFIFGDVGVAC